MPATTSQRAGNRAPSTSADTQRRASGAGASTSPATGRKNLKQPRPNQQQLFLDAESSVKDLEAAVAFLQEKMLIPEGDAAVSEEALISGLLHFASATPAAALAQKGLIAFAHVAKAVMEKKTLGRLATAVAERVEQQIEMRLDHHTSKVEEEIAGVSQELERLRDEYGRVAERMERAERGQTQVH